MLLLLLLLLPLLLLSLLLVVPLLLLLLLLLPLLLVMVACPCRYRCRCGCCRGCGGCGGVAVWRSGGVVEWWSGGVVVAAVAVVVVAAVAVVAARTITRMKVSQSVPTGSGLARPLIEARLPRLGLAQQCKCCSWTYSSGMGENMAVLRRDVCNRDVRDPCPYSGSASARLCHTHNIAGSWKMKR